jgi:hypothetical protein
MWRSTAALEAARVLDTTLQLVGRAGEELVAGVDWQALAAALNQAEALAPRVEREVDGEARRRMGRAISSTPEVVLHYRDTPMLAKSVRHPGRLTHDRLALAPRAGVGVLAAPKPTPLPPRRAGVFRARARVAARLPIRQSAPRRYGS